MCLQQTLFLRRVIILGAPLWVRLCFGNWFWILDSFLFEPPCRNPFYQSLWAEAEVLLPRDPAYRTSCFCSSCGARAGSSPGPWADAGLWDMLALVFAALLRGLYFTSVSHIPDYSLNWLDHSCTGSKEGTSALSPTLRWLCSLWGLIQKCSQNLLTGWIKHTKFTLPPSHPNPTVSLSISNMNIIITATRNQQDAVRKACANRQSALELHLKL